MNKIIIGSFLALILFSLYLIASNSTKPGETSRRVIATSKVSGPSPVNIDLDSSFNNFKNFSTLTYNRLHCELYEEKSRHVYALGKFNSQEYDAQTSELLLALIKEINKVKTQKSLLENLKLSKPSRINIDTSKLDRLYNNLIKSKQNIDIKEGQIKIMKENFKPSVVSGKQFEIDVEKQIINYLDKRVSYLLSLKPKSAVAEPMDHIDKVLDRTETTFKTIILDIHENKNKIKSIDEAQNLGNLRQYWVLRLEEVKKCQKTDQNYRSGQGPDIYRELERLGKAQKSHENDGYCMELKKHLVMKLIREFDVIQSDFNCIKEKGKIESEIRKIDAEVLRLKQMSIGNYDPERYDNDLEQFKRTYDDYSSTWEKDVKKVEMGYDEATLRDMIESVEIQLRQHRNRLHDLMNRNTTDSGDDPQMIVNLVNENIRLKADYCRDFEQYQRQNQFLRNKLDQISGERSVQHVGAERYLKISNEIKKSLQEIGKIKDSLTGRLKV